jgi:hypothetical protein
MIVLCRHACAFPVQKVQYAFDNAVKAHGYISLTGR